ncbi:hypothetical protein AXG93_4620s1790 [Marchantia polymorpha subsp. ruderalis]|uniref:Auxin-responsive protein n=1 Tax=Marchantia polymorpha subsp. ruderalis TaxID=1480154 RepID=A0A176VX26_MARPO|nr:hypothetical protein AXG93_4620s1790 [Marchantia polymorpha subsp. ruderalis]
MNLSSASSVSWSLVNNGALTSGASGNQNISASASHQQQQQDAKAAASPQNSNQSGSTLKEHDLLGLSEPQQAPAVLESGNSHAGSENAAANEQQQQQQADRGLASYGVRGGGDMSQAGMADAASGNQGCRPSIDSEALMKWHAEQQRGPAQDGADRNFQDDEQQQQQQQQQPEQQQRFQSAQQDLESRAGYAVAAQGFAAQQRNVANGSDARSLPLPLPLSGGGPMSSSNSPSSEAEAKALCQQQMKAQSGLPMYPWGPKAAIPSQWHIGLEQSGGSFGPFPSQRPGRAPMSKPPSEAGVDAKVWDGQAKSHQEIVSTASQQQQQQQQKMSAPAETKQQSSNEAAPSPAADVAVSSAPRAAAAPPAVGWPPIRSFRKNLGVTPRQVPPETPPRQTAPQQPAVSTPSVAGQSNSWFVKVHMDGVPIGRKVDLRTNSSYEKLSQMLDEMFRTFVNGQNGSNRITLASDIKRNFLQGPDYVLTYEDQDGDLMLVGDVPWTMFIDTVKRLRIMKGSEAIGLGTRAAEKANKTTQPNV